MTRKGAYDSPMTQKPTAAQIDVIRHAAGMTWLSERSPRSTTYDVCLRKGWIVRAEAGVLAYEATEAGLAAINPANLGRRGRRHA